MKTFRRLLAIGLVLALAIGCSSTRNNEIMLSAAGFKTVPADSAERQAHLNSLPADKITPVERNNVLYYAFPDPKKNVLYIGQEPQYQEYQRLCIQQQMLDEQLIVDQMDEYDPAQEEWEPGWDWR